MIGWGGFGLPLLSLYSIDGTYRLGCRQFDMGVAMPIQTVAFYVSGAPFGKERPRSTQINGRSVVYTPKKTADYERHIRQVAWAAMSKERIGITDKAVHMSIEAVFPIPASWPQKRKLIASMGGEKPKKKPDLSNVFKAIEDGCNGVVYEDDAQICSFTAVKTYESETKRAGVYVTVAWSKPDTP